MNHIRPYDLFERNDIEPSLLANEIVDKWEAALKAEAQRLVNRYFPRRLSGYGNIREDWSDLRALSYEIHYSYDDKHITVDGFTFTVHHQSDATQGEYLPSNKLIIINDNALSSALNGIHQQAKYYLNNDTDWRGAALTKSKDRTAAKAKAVEHLETIMTMDYRHIKTTLAHEIIHAMDDKTWLDKSTDKLQKFLTKKIGKKSVQYGYQYVKGAEYSQAYHNAGHERNAFYRAFVATLMRDLKSGTVKLDDFSGVNAFKEYCIKTYDTRRGELSPKNQRILDKRIVDLYLRLKSGEGISMPE